MALHAGGSQNIWRGVCGGTDLGVFPGQMSVILEGIAVAGEVIIQTFGARSGGMLMLLAFLICREHHFWILSLSLAYRADTHVGGLASSRRGVFNMQNCPLAYWHVLNCSSDISMHWFHQVLCLSTFLYVVACREISVRYIQIKYFIYFCLLCTILYWYIDQ